MNIVHFKNKKKMKVTNKEKERIKAMLLHFIKQKHNISGGNNGFSLPLFNGVLSICLTELEEEGLIKSRKVITGNHYFYKRIKH